MIRLFTPTTVTGGLRGAVAARVLCERGFSESTTMPRAWRRLDQYR
nr:hypothetical protein MBRU_07700 [Mycolicibacterium brumae DSM 44177]